jgi:hypothetical protein
LNPIGFPEANRTFTKPASMTDEECAPLHIQDTGAELVSMWQPDERERELLGRGAPVVLRVVGRGHPPVGLAVADVLTAAFLKQASGEDLASWQKGVEDANRIAQRERAEADAARALAERLNADLATVRAELEAARAQHARDLAALAPLADTHRRPGCSDVCCDATAPRLLAKHQPCGCVVCTCENEEEPDRCLGCGAKSCGTHIGAPIPNPVYEDPAPAAAPETTQLQDVRRRWARHGLRQHRAGHLGARW